MDMIKISCGIHLLFTVRELALPLIDPWLEKNHRECKITTTTLSETTTAS
jgi:hypothetical protein